MRLCFISSMFGAPWAASEFIWTKTAHAALDDGHAVAVVYKHWEQLPRAIVDLKERGATLFLRKVDIKRPSSRVFERLVHPLPAIVRWRPEVVCMNLGNFVDAVTRPDLRRFAAKIRAPYVIVI